MTPRHARISADALSMYIQDQQLAAAKEAKRSACSTHRKLPAASRGGRAINQPATASYGADTLQYHWLNDDLPMKRPPEGQSKK